MQCHAINHYKKCADKWDQGIIGTLKIINHIILFHGHIAFKIPLHDTNECMYAVSEKYSLSIILTVINSFNRMDKENSYCITTYRECSFKVMKTDGSGFHAGRFPNNLELACLFQYNHPWGSSGSSYISPRLRMSNQKELLVIPIAFPVCSAAGIVDSFSSGPASPTSCYYNPFSFQKALS